MLASYAADFAAQWGRKARDLMTEVADWYGLKVRDDVAARDAWELARWNSGIRAYRGTGGGMVTAGIGGPLTGRGGDIIIIDDPVKNAEEAFSAVYREKTWEWFNSTLYSRLEPNAAIVLILTRWHYDDLAGRLLAQSAEGGEYWEHINLPALAIENDPLGRQPGEALWPERYDVDRLREIETSVGPYWFSALYQQNPVPLGAGIFAREDFRYYEETESTYNLRQPDGTLVIVPKNQCVKFSTIDLAVSVKTSADYTVIGTFAKTPLNDLITLDITKQRLEGPDQLPMLQSIWMQYRPSQMHIESVGYQLALIQQARRAGLPILPITPDKDKIARALLVSARMKAGTVYFPTYAPWMRGEEGLEAELLGFPAMKHDDQVDVMAYAAYVVAGSSYAGNLG